MPNTVHPAVPPAACPLCQGDTGTVELWRNAQLRVVEVDMPGYPGYMRVIWNRHVAEMSDLAPHERGMLMDVVMLVEQTLREHLAPAKINLAALGNMVPHLHWHIIPRWRDDPHFPDAIWATAHRAPEAVTQASRQARLPACRTALRQALDASPQHSARRP